MFTAKNIEKYIIEKSERINNCTDCATYRGMMADVSDALADIVEKCTDPFAPDYFRTLFDILNDIALAEV